jgi:hypothetical protein
MLDFSDSDDVCRIKPMQLAALVVADEHEREEYYAMSLLRGTGCAEGDMFGV